VRERERETKRESERERESEQASEKKTERVCHVTRTNESKNSYVIYFSQPAHNFEPGPPPSTCFVTHTNKIWGGYY